MRRPEEILTDLSDKRQALVDKITLEIDHQAEKVFTGDAFDHWIQVKSTTEAKAVWPAVARFLEQHGWSGSVVEEMDSQRDGAGIRVRIEPASNAHG